MDADRFGDQRTGEGLAFTKMHGVGNDFLIVDIRSKRGELPNAALCRQLADRHRGVGFDQLVAICDASSTADAILVFMNADGTAAGACGNGTRCAADLLMGELGTDKVRLRTDGGVLECERMGECEVQVNMGRPEFDWRMVPLAEEADTLQLPVPDSLSGVAKSMGAVSMGNPHCVVFVGDIEYAPVDAVGPELETSSLFPERANVSFAEVTSPVSVRLQVWERGVGSTLACGSAACAVVAVGVRCGLLEREVDVEFRFGTLRVEWPDDQSGVFMSGPVTKVFTGWVEPAHLASLRNR